MTSHITISGTNLSVFPLCLGGNVFGWSADQEQSFTVLDAYVEAGGNFIDTADVYSAWKEGNQGGESETIIGNWMKARGNRDQLVIATKVGMWEAQKGLSAGNIKSALEGSLKRLQTDHIDLYYSHVDDAAIPLYETLGTYTELKSAGKIQHAAASNYNLARLREAAHVSQSHEYTKYVAVQNKYNLLDRAEFEGDIAQGINGLGIHSISYYGLARGFLSGKYQPGVTVDSMRAGGAAEYQNDRGWATLNEVEKIAQELGSNPSAISLAWLRAKGSLPIASARTVEQLKEIVQVVELSDSHIRALDAVSALS
jgi:aryl-alcohol dehydrogenase-like predicted oxidoreductase